MSIDENLTDDKQAREALSSSKSFADAIAVELVICPWGYLRSEELCALWTNLRSGLFYAPGRSSTGTR
ncbi:hypothetical protein ACWGE0_45040 [Lentzea sp. NPDC054927]